MRKKPYTTAEFFNVIKEKLAESKLLPEILDYSTATTGKEQLTTYEWDPICRLTIGSNEGIYLSVYAEGNFANGFKTLHLGTFKTLYDDREALYIMAKLQADFIWEARDLVNRNLDDFEWTGYSVSFYDSDGIKKLGISTPDTKRVIARYKDSYSYVIVRDNATRKEERIDL